jgi:predicted N-acetyltransferase YhbS
LILLARLAVDHRFQKKGLGNLLLSEALKIRVNVSEQVGCRCVITAAYPERVGWYARYGFIALEGETDKRVRKMFLDIRTLKAAAETG